MLSYRLPYFEDRKDPESLWAECKALWYQIVVRAKVLYCSKISTPFTKVLREIHIELHYPSALMLFRGRTLIGSLSYCLQQTCQDSPIHENGSAKDNAVEASFGHGYVHGCNRLKLIHFVGIFFSGFGLCIKLLA